MGHDLPWFITSWPSPPPLLGDRIQLLTGRTRVRFWAGWLLILSKKKVISGAKLGTKEEEDRDRLSRYFEY